jgi:parvulin-like peptidyl-prolyl isomerase
MKLTAVILMLAVLTVGFAACGASPTAVKVGDEKVSYDLLRYFTMNYRRDAGYTSEEYAADPKLAEELEKQVYSALREVMAYRALADEFDISLTKEEKQSISDSLEALKGQYADDAAYKKALEEGYLTEEVFVELQELQLLAQRIYNLLTAESNNIIPSDDSTIDADIAAGNFFSAEYLYIYYVESDKAEKLEFANELHGRLLAGEKMKDLDNEYATEYALAMEYVLLNAFTYTQQTEDFEELVLSLKEGEYSKPIVRGDGILIARRLPLSDEYVEKNYNEIIDSYKEREFARYVEAYGEKMEISYQSKYKDLKLWEME